MTASGRHPTDPCPGEGALLAFLDDEPHAGGTHEVSEHVDACPRCADRLAALRRRDARVRAWIREHDPAPPPREAYDLGPPSPAGGGIPWWAAAAAVLLVVAAAAGPARGWIAGEVRSLFGDSGDPGPPAPVVVEEASGATALLPEGPELELVFTSSRTRGRLVVDRSPDARMILREPDPRVRLTVRAGGVRVENEATPSGDYRISVPASLRRLRVRVTGVGDTVLDVAGLEDVRVLELPPGPGVGG